jgi:hypothetical protein
MLPYLCAPLNEDSVAQQVEHPALREGPGFLEKLKLIQ